MIEKDEIIKLLDENYKKSDITNTMFYVPDLDEVVYTFFNLLLLSNTGNAIEDVREAFKKLLPQEQDVICRIFENEREMINFFVRLNIFIKEVVNKLGG